MRERVRWGRGLHVVSLVMVMALLAACGGAGALAPAGEGQDGGQAGAPLPGNGGEPDRSGVDADTPADAKLVYTGTLQLVVDELQPALVRAQAEIAALGGFVSASQEFTKGDQPRATITYRIPSARWSEALTTLRALATEVVSEETQATEVGAQLVDLEARIRNLRSSEAALQQIATNTTKVSDLLEVERRLTDVRGDIESLDAQRSRLADQVAYGTLAVSYGRDVPAVTQAAKEWNPAAEVDRATATLVGAGQALLTAGIWFAIVWLPFLAALAVALVVARWGYRRWSRRHPRGGEAADPIPGWSTGGTGGAGS
jgi:hypothetical protein